MPICRDCGNKEYFYAVESVYTKFRFDTDAPEDTCADDTETIEYIDEGTPKYECSECHKMDIAVGEDAKDVEVTEVVIDQSPNEFIARNSKLLV